jgi:hypothetical protein
MHGKAEVGKGETALLAIQNPSHSGLFLCLTAHDDHLTFVEVDFQA